MSDSSRHWKGNAAAQGIANSDTLKVGRFLTVNRIFITGNRITRDKIIIRELSLKTGDVVFSADLEALLDLDRKKLLNTRLFNTVDIRMLELEPMRIDLIVEVTERWYTFPAPIFELADRNFNDWWQNYNHDLERVNYGLRLYQYNMRGRNETLRLHAQFGFQRRFEILYRFPYIDKQQKHGLSFDFTYAETKNAVFRTFDHKYEFLQAENILRTNRFGGITYTYRNSFYQTHFLKAEYYNTFFDDTLQEINPIYMPRNESEQTYTSLTYGFTSDHRDYVSYPLKGHVLSTEARAVGLLASDDVEKLEVTVSYSKYLTLKKKFFLSNNIVGYASTPSDLPYINFGVLGLRRQFVRGYEIYVIEGPFYAINKTTFKKLLFARNYHWVAMPIEQFRHIPLAVYLKTYADFGYVKNYDPYETLQINTRLSDKLITGAGVGVDIVGSYDVVLRFEYTFNAEGERGFFFHLRREF
ncbi:MAG TPA: BamA/TamA family outer membrane protein [Chryseosolibacter sp.]|nr:BamA/TamA family outer membrane protein [Chryseosolibacter sp.]